MYLWSPTHTGCDYERLRCMQDPGTRTPLEVRPARTPREVRARPVVYAATASSLTRGAARNSTLPTTL
jgi:hypothetical protein